MNFLKIKLGFFSLLAVLAVSVFLTSCEQENPLNPIAVDDVAELQVPESTTQNNAMLMPKGLVNQDNDKVMEYLGNLSEDDMEILREDYRIGEFLKSIDMYDQVYASLEDGSGFSEIKLEEWLTGNQIQELEAFNINNTIEARNTAYWTHCYYGSSWFCSYIFDLDMGVNSNHDYNGYFRWRCRPNPSPLNDTTPFHYGYWGITDRRYCN